MIRILVASIIVILILWMRVLKVKGLINDFKYSIIKIVGIVIVCELTLFNINSYRFIFSNYKEKTFTRDDFTLENLTYVDNDTYVMDDSTATIILNANDNVGNIYFDASPVHYKKIEYRIMYTDDTSKNFRKLDSKFLVDSIEKSKYTTSYLSGKSKKIAIDISGNRNDKLQINSIKINHPLQFEFNTYRVIFICFVAILLYSIKNCSFWSSTFAENEKGAKIVVFITIFCFILLIFMLGKNNYSISGDIYSNDFSKAILNGKFSLQGKANPDLASLKNPYDFTIREGDIFRNDWDLAYFNNKYYMYFGILPALILYAPYMLLTGSFLPTGIGVIIFTSGVILNLGILLFLILKQWFYKLPLKLWLYCEIILLSGSVLFDLIGRPMFYENAIASALFFASASMIFIFKYLTEKHLKHINLLLSSLLLSLSVACRPTMVILFIIPITIVVLDILKSKLSKKNIIKPLLAFLIPCSLIAILLMFYNYIRFQNPFDFGAGYQITINDMGKLKNRIMTIPVGLYTAFLKFPHFMSKFPFIKPDSETLSFFGYFYTEDNIAGLFWLVPTMLSILYIPKLKTKFKNRKMEYIVKSFTITGIIICIASITNAGVLQRYLADYAWLLNISALIVLMIIYENYKHIETKKVLQRIIGICAIYTLCFNIISGGIVGEKNLMENLSPEVYYRIRYSVCFWE